MDQPSENQPETPRVPPRLSETQPPPIVAPPPMIAGTSSTGPSSATGKTSGLRQMFAILLSLGLMLFLADAVVSLANYSLILLFDVHILAGLHGMLFFFAILVSLVIYGLMGLTPIIPKRWFLPLTLFVPVVSVLIIPLLIYFQGHVHRLSWIVSLCQVLVGLGILYLVQGGFAFRWPILRATQLTGRGFSWGNMALFVILNLFVLLPAAVGYLAFSASTAVNHYSDGFMGLRPSGFTVQARTYVRDDGKTIQLYPMAHIGDAAFYRKLSQSFPTNSIILTEGVMDRNNLLTNKPSYNRLATSLGLADQQKEFSPGDEQRETVNADMDAEEFAPETIELINLIMLVHAKGLTPENLMMLMQYSPSPEAEKQLFDDILRKRNRHLLKQIDAHLSESDIIVVPWGAAHMPEIAREIQKSGFRLKETEEFVVVRFGGGNQEKSR